MQEWSGRRVYCPLFIPGPFTPPKAHSSRSSPLHLLTLESTTPIFSLLLHASLRGQERKPEREIKREREESPPRRATTAQHIVVARRCLTGHHQSRPARIHGEEGDRTGIGSPSRSPPALSSRVASVASSSSHHRILPKSYFGEKLRTGARRNRGTTARCHPSHYHLHVVALRSSSATTTIRP